MNLRSLNYSTFIVLLDGASENTYGLEKNYMNTLQARFYFNMFIVILASLLR